MFNSHHNTLDESTISQINKEYQVYFIFVIFYISLQLICNTIEPIILHFSIFTIPASAMFYVLSFAISDVLTENFGFKLAVRATILNVISQFIYCGIAAAVLMLPTIYKTSHESDSFQYVFHFLSLELFGSIASLVIAMITNDYIIDQLKFIFLGRGFWWRTIISTIFGEIVMLNIDYNITFLGTKSLLAIQHLIFGAMSYKIVAALVLALPITILSRYISNKVFLLKPSMNKKIPLMTDLKNAVLFR